MSGILAYLCGRCGKRAAHPTEAHPGPNGFTRNRDDVAALASAHAMSREIEQTLARSRRVRRRVLEANAQLARPVADEPPTPSGDEHEGGEG